MRHDSSHNRICGNMWLGSLVLGVSSLLALFFISEGNELILFPLGVSVFFMVLFWRNVRRERDVFSDFNEPTYDQQDALTTMPDPAGSTDSELRSVFDRFDSMVIDQCEQRGMSGDRIASFLDYAREFVDQTHAATLFRDQRFNELEIHLTAAHRRAMVSWQQA